MKLRFIQPNVFWDRGKTRVSLRNPRGRPVINLKTEDYELAICFDGNRTIEEVLDYLVATTGRRADRQAVESLISRLKHAGFMEVVVKDSPPPANPLIRPPLPASQHGTARRLRAGRYTPSPPQPTEVASQSAEKQNLTAESPVHPSDPDISSAADDYTSSANRPEKPPVQSPEERHATEVPIRQFSSEKNEPLGYDEGVQEDWHQALDSQDIPPGNFSERRMAAQRLLRQRAGNMGGRWGRFQQRGEEAQELQKPSLRKKRIHLLNLPVAWILPLAGSVSRVLESRFALSAVGVLLAFVGFGLWFNRPALAADVSKIFLSWELLQRLILILLTVDLSDALIKAGAIWRATGQVPKFSLELRFALMHAVPWVSFQTDLSLMRQMQDRSALLRVIGASLLSNALWIIAAAVLWLASRRSGGSLSVYALEVLLLASIFLVLALNPLGKSALYHLISLKMGVRNLRGLAFRVLFGKQGPEQKLPVPAWALRVYAFASIAFMLAATFLLVYYLGGWLTDELGGLGALYLIIILALIFLEPATRLYQAFRRKGKRGEAEQNPPKNPKGLWPRRLVYVALIGLICLLPYEYETSGEFELLPAAKSEIHTKIEGNVREVLVKEGDWVSADQVLIRLSNEEQSIKVVEIEQKIVEFNANLLKARHGATSEQIAVARQAVEAAKTRYDFSRRQVERYAQLLKEKFISEQAYENMRGQAENDRQSLELAQRNLEELMAGTRSEDITALQAQLGQARAQLDYYQHQLGTTEVRSPIAGRVVSGSLIYAVGDHLKPEDPLMVIEDSRSLLVQIKVPETDIALLPKVPEVRLRAWSMPETSFTGKVQRIAPAAEPGDIGRVLRVQLEFDNSKLKLPSALTGYAKVSCGEMPLISAFTRMFVRFFMVEVWSWLP